MIKFHAPVINAGRRVASPQVTTQPDSGKTRNSQTPLRSPMRRQILFVFALALAATLTRCGPPEPTPDALSGSSGSVQQALTPGGGLKVMTYNIKHGEL